MRCCCRAAARTPRALPCRCPVAPVALPGPGLTQSPPPAIGEVGPTCGIPSHRRSAGVSSPTATALCILDGAISSSVSKAECDSRAEGATHPTRAWMNKSGAVRRHMTGAPRFLSSSRACPVVVGYTLGAELIPRILCRRLARRICGLRPRPSGGGVQQSGHACRSANGACVTSTYIISVGNSMPAGL